MQHSFEEVRQFAHELPEEQRLRLALDLYDGLTPHPELASQDPGYDQWVREQVQASLDDPSPDIPHQQVVNGVRAAIRRTAELRKRSA